MEAPQVNNTEKREYYAAKAKEADETAAKAPDSEVRAKVQQIADGYRSLATFYGKLKL